MQQDLQDLAWEAKSCARTPLNHSSRYYDTHRRMVERAGLGYGTRLSGYTTLDHPRGRVSVL
jgi:hypothetical protein